MYTIKQVQDSFNTFYQVTLNGVICFQADNYDACLAYVNANSDKTGTIELSKAVINLATKNEIGLALDLNTNVYGKEQALDMDYQATLTVWLDANEDHEGDAIYKLYKTAEGFKAVLWDVWTTDNKEAFTASFEGNKGLTQMIKQLAKFN